MSKLPIVDTRPTKYMTYRQKIARLPAEEAREQFRLSMMPHETLRHKKLKVTPSVTISDDVKTFLEMTGINPEAYKEVLAKVIVKGYEVKTLANPNEISALYPSAIKGIHLRVSYEKKSGNKFLVKYVTFGEFTGELLKQFNQTPQEVDRRIVVYDGLTIDVDLIISKLPNYPRPTDFTRLMRAVVEREAEHDGKIILHTEKEGQEPGTKVIRQIVKKKSKGYLTIRVVLKNDIVVKAFITPSKSLNKKELEERKCEVSLGTTESNQPQ